LHGSLGYPGSVSLGAVITSKGKDGSITGGQKCDRKQYGMDQALVDGPFLRVHPIIPSLVLGFGLFLFDKYVDIDIFVERLRLKAS
jgi:hypothetical protein